MNIFDILCTSTQGQNFGEGQGHSGNDVMYTRVHWELDSLIWFECMTNVGQYLHVK